MIPGQYAQTKKIPCNYFKTARKKNICVKNFLSVFYIQYGHTYSRTNIRIKHLMISHKAALNTGQKYRLLARKTRGEEKKNIFPTESKKIQKRQ